MVLVPNHLKTRNKHRRSPFILFFFSIFFQMNFFLYYFSLFFFLSVFFLSRYHTSEKSSFPLSVTVLLGYLFRPSTLLLSQVL